jgi:hypothetical protein
VLDRGLPIHAGFTKYSSIFNKGQIASAVPQILHESTREVASVFLSPVFLPVVHLE